MDKINDGGPAFPATWANDSDLNAIAPNGQVCPPFSSIPLPGMSLRDYFAAKVMQGALADSNVTLEKAGDADILAKASYRIADAMLRARGEA
ncbi:hypothetical protein UXJ26_06030 [Burkholderia multivorans]|uniref:Bacteriophage protein n=1 Tax=Burkholderia multivorans (strain ATCC 17616 / 249) TaxID=395019 RepID=A0A0H3KMQ4_BURM1|nr:MULTISPECIES: hypothetical protein [Burkholderia cepacia complex]YP_355373.1 gp38 [Burkholderia phage Bcep176]ABA60039.1 gp38 [Burkholderia phage Bcep176]ABX17522.1 GP38 [Burkholderia multivorans ATCC 17616]MBR8312409.1 hypothetical protein [Burkholderia dolosa]PRF62428.1 hypothetical protein C6Q28_10645 [Burkholderia multivorans]BAG46526.1 bacteriophage protein [Burkholderia multivorans ATCC 17616]